MSRPLAGSSPSAELTPGTVVAGFRIERVLGRGSRATVYEATQLSLDRRVALKVMDDRGLAKRIRQLSWPDHPGAVSLYGIGDSEHGPWLAMQLVTGGTLETHRARLDEVAAALDRAHADGVVHGDVRARNVLVRDGGRAFLSDFGLAGEGATAEDDRVALVKLVRERGLRPSRRRGALLAAGAVALTAVVVGVVLASGDGDSDSAAGAAPPAPAGTRSIGSELAPGDAASADCEGHPPDGASLACTISQRELDGHPVVVPADGTITSWAVRGARGPLALQVLRGRGSKLEQVAKSAEETVPGPAVHLVRTTLAVAAGDRIALEVDPGAAIGLRRGGEQAPLDRWFGPLLRPLRRPERPAGTGLDRELLLRVDVSPRVDIPAVRALRGDDAAGAPSGRRIASRTVGVGGGEVRRVTLVTLGSGAVVIDLFDGTRRLARAPVQGADGRGRLVAFSGGDGVVRVRWRNPDGRTVRGGFEVSPSALR